MAAPVHAVTLALTWFALASGTALPHNSQLRHCLPSIGACHSVLPSADWSSESLCVSLCALVTGTRAAAAAPRSSAAGFLRYADFAGQAYNVSYDKRSLLINGERSYFASVGVHYPRFTEGQWDDIFLKAKNDGYNMVQTYFFHNAHQPKLSQWPWNMEGPANLTLFLQKAAAAGLFVDLRIGPYVCAEWSWGGYPYDLANVPGLVSRSDNPQWESCLLWEQVSFALPPLLAAPSRDPPWTAQVHAGGRAQRHA